MVDLSKASEELLSDIKALHDELTFIHDDFADTLGIITEVAREVYVRDNIATGMTAAATPAYYHLNTGVVTTAPDDGIIYFSTGGGGGGGGGSPAGIYGGGRGGLGRHWTWNWELHH